jgi:hypothetical protein
MAQPLAGTPGVASTVEFDWKKGRRPKSPRVWRLSRAGANPGPANTPPDLRNRASEAAAGRAAGPADAGQRKDPNRKAAIVGVRSAPFVR